jgi:hypothetical protein
MRIIKNLIIAKKIKLATPKMLTKSITNFAKIKIYKINKN